MTRALRLFDWVESGQLNVNIGQRYLLADAAQAHIEIASRRTTGKLLLISQPKLRSLDPRPRARRRPYGSAEVIHKLGPKLPGSQFWSVSDPRL